MPSSATYHCVPMGQLLTAQSPLPESGCGPLSQSSVASHPRNQGHTYLPSHKAVPPGPRELLQTTGTLSGSCPPTLPLSREVIWVPALCSAPGGPGLGQIK